MFTILKTLMSSLVSRPDTLPHSEATTSPHALRGHIENDIEQCIFCGICRRKCPTEAIDVDRPGQMWAIERFRCIQCNSCVENCPKKCLSMRPERMKANTELTKDVLHARIPADTADHPDG